MKVIKLKVVVQDAAGKPYRYRIGTYNSKGQLVKLRIKNSSGDFAITDIGYDAYGNITLVRQPANSKGQRYHLQYSYDTATSTYIESITDTLGYTSTAKYDVAFGVPLWTRDVSGASMQYQYDVFGRLTMLWGPYDVGGRPAIAVEYAGAIVTGEGVSRPVGAITTNRSGGDYSSEALTVVRYTDGLGRDLQVKTSATVAGQYGYTVSGAKRYDAMGRVVAEGKPQFEPGASTGYTLSAMQYPTYYQYDCMGRKTLTTYPDGGEVIAGYGIRNGTLMECITDQNGNSKQCLVLSFVTGEQQKKVPKKSACVVSVMIEAKQTGCAGLPWLYARLQPSSLPSVEGYWKHTAAGQGCLAY